MYIKVALLLASIATIARGVPVCPAQTSMDFPTFGPCQTPDGQTGICQSTVFTCPGPGFNVGGTGCPEHDEVRAIWVISDGEIQCCITS